MEEAQTVQIIQISAATYPHRLRHIFNPPEILYARGNVELLQQNALAIVGTRKCTDYGKVNALHFTKGLVSYGFIIVSGLAYGIDAIAHQAVLEEGGKTIAVLGNAIDQIQPERNVALAKAILKSGGLIVSEYGPGAPTYPANFPKRNRIISGLSLGTLIVEAPQKSGALITAHHAFQQNREVFALPSDLSRASCSGNLQLLANEIARVVRTPEDIIARLSHQPELVLQPIVKKTRHPQFTTVAQKGVWKCLSPHPISVDVLIKRSKLSVEEVLIALSYLELKGHIRDIGNANYILS